LSFFTFNFIKSHSHTAEIVCDIDLRELDTGRGANQIGFLQRSGDTDEVLTSSPFAI
jgi:hypothetical protein